MSVSHPRPAISRTLVETAPSSAVELAPADAQAMRLTGAMVAGHRQALAELFGIRCVFVERESGRALGRRADLVPDAAQEAWLRVARRPVPCAHALALDAWLRRVAVSAAIDLLRSDLARRAREHRVARTCNEAEAFAADVAQLDTAQAALAALSGLAAEDLSLLELRARTGASLAQLATALGLGTAAVDSRLRRAAERARRMLEGKSS